MTQKPVRIEPSQRAPRCGREGVALDLLETIPFGMGPYGNLRDSDSGRGLPTLCDAGTAWSTDEVRVVAEARAARLQARFISCSVED